MQLGVEECTRNLSAIAKACANTEDINVKEISTVKERSPALHLRKVPSGQDLIQLCL